MSFPNYVDFDYWAYQYAEGDVRSIQDAQGTIFANGDLSAALTLITPFQAQAFITANGTVTAIPRFITPFNAQANITAFGNLTSGLGVTRFGDAQITSSGTLTTLISNFRPGEALIVSSGDMSGDAIRLRVMYGSVTSTGTMTGTAKATYAGLGTVSGVGNVNSAANFTASAKGEIIAYGELIAPLYKLGEEWSTIPDEPNVWTSVLGGFKNNTGGYSFGSFSSGPFNALSGDSDATTIVLDEWIPANNTTSVWRRIS